jgi:hypothetical protein
MEMLLSEQRKCSDPELESSGGSMLVYFFLCQSCVLQNMYHRFTGQMVAVYWKEYPLTLKIHIATAFRMAKGKHSVRVDLVNMASRAATFIAKAEVESKCSSMIDPIDGDLIVVVPSPGVYFINAYVDDKLVGSEILSAETDEPMFSYELFPEDIARVSAGELALMAKRSQFRTEDIKQ